MKRTYFVVNWSTLDSLGGLRNYSHVFEGSDILANEILAKVFARKKAAKNRVYSVKIFRFDAVRINDSHEATTATKIEF